jgi:Tfp pilus assembly protein PilP
MAVEHRPLPARPVAAAVAPGPVAVEPAISRRDPFAPLIQVAAGGREMGEHLPPGIGGLVVATVRIDGTVQAPSGTFAVVSNPDDRVYFIHVGDRLYDGDVEKINLDGVTFQENSKDAFGKPVERLVTKRLYPSAGEQQ